MAISIDRTGYTPLAKNHTVTASWTDLGADTIINTSDVETLCVWVDITNAGTATDVQFQFLAKQSPSGSGYNMPLMTVSSSTVLVDPEVHILNSDTTQKQLVCFSLGKSVAMGTLQVKRGGGSNVTINAVDLSLGATIE